MSGRLPWVAATLVIVIAAGLGAWALSTPETATPSQPTPTTTAGWGLTSARATITENNGIVGIYIMSSGQYDNSVDLNAENGLSTSDNMLENISFSGEAVNIAYETLFDLVLDVVITAPDYAAYATGDNVYGVLFVSGEFTENENTLAGSANENEVVYASQGLGTNDGWVRINIIMDNRGNGYKLRAGQSLDIDTAAVYGWK